LRALLRLQPSRTGTYPWMSESTFHNTLNRFLFLFFYYYYYFNLFFFSLIIIWMHFSEGYMCQCIFYITQLLIFLLGYTQFPLSTLTVPKSRLLPPLNCFASLSLSVSHFLSLHIHRKFFFYFLHVLLLHHSYVFSLATFPVCMWLCFC